MSTSGKTTLERVSAPRLTSQTVLYRERLRVPWWWWPVGIGGSAVLAYEVNLGVRPLPDWLPYAVLAIAAAGVLMWLGRVEVRAVETPTGIELLAGPAHLPAAVITRSGTIPKAAKSAALGRQLDPAAYVLHRTWVGPMVLVVLDDPDDPTPYWLISTRHPERMLAALKR